MAEKIIDLKTITKYKDEKSVIEAILDDDFRTKYSVSLASIIRIRDARKRKVGYEIIQRHIDPKSLRKIALALDYYGYMYEYKKDPSFCAEKKEPLLDKDKVYNKMPKEEKKNEFSRTPRKKKATVTAHVVFAEKSNVR